MDNINYRLTAKDWGICLIEYVGIISCLSYLFYDSAWSCVIFFPFIIWFVKYIKMKKATKNNEILSRQFLKALQCMTTSLAAGFSPENSFVEAANDMEKMFGRKSIIVRELKYINNQVSLGKRLEDSIYEVAQRTGNNSIKDFATVFEIACINGENFVKVISSCVSIMQMANDTAQEARVLIRGKQYEQRIMSIIPLGIILYLRFSSGSFIAVLYHNVPGVIVMTACLIFYIASLYIAEYICHIEVY